MKKYIISTEKDKADLGRDIQLGLNAGVVMEVKVEIYDPHRTLPQNDLIHPLVRQIKSHLERSGATERPLEWWRAYLVAEYAGQEVIPSRVEGGKFVVVNKVGGTSQFKKTEASDFIDWLYSYGTDIGVNWEE